MAFQKGHSKMGGRTTGSENKTTSSVKQVVLSVFQDLQNSPENSLRAWAEKQPTEFYKIASKLIPTDIKADVKTVSKITLEIVRKDHSARIEPAPFQPAESN